jgi:hypothetical protein
MSLTDPTLVTATARLTSLVRRQLNRRFPILAGFPAPNKHN